jgi:hypothetical protein
VEGRFADAVQELVPLTLLGVGILRWQRKRGNTEAQDRKYGIAREFHSATSNGIDQTVSRHFPEPLIAVEIKPVSRDGSYVRQNVGLREIPALWRMQLLGECRSYFHRKP